MIRLLSCLTLIAPVAHAETLIATRNLRAQTVITEADITWSNNTSVGLTDPAQAIGLETRVAIYAGRPIRANDLGPPALVERNQIVTLIYASQALQIETEGRALGRAGAGEVLRVQNLTSRTSVTGQVQSDGTVVVTGTP